MIVELIVISAVLTVLFIISLIFARSKSILHLSDVVFSRKTNILIAIVILITVLACTIPMNLSPIWNGEIPEHRNQYEKIAEGFLNGHLYFDYEVDDTLENLDNPYDPEQRTESGAEFLWDHAYYNGHYYMYFGVVPVVLVFLPFRFITGFSLTTYHATQLFTALFIVGMFFVFYKLVKKFFPKLPLSVYLYLSVAFSVMSVWHAIAAPALYTTAIVSGLAMMIWGIYFWMRAVWNSENRKSSIINSTTGSLFGALAFGCRPPIALGNIVIFVMIVYYLRNHHFKRKWIDVLVFMSPYIIIGILLAWYNYARFNSVFEFGQSYQLTSADIKNMPNLFNSSSLHEKTMLLLTYFTNIGKYLFTVAGIRHFVYNGTIVTFPIILLSLVVFVKGQSRKLIKEKKIRLLFYMLIVTIFLILLTDVFGSPDVAPRYRMDTYWLFAIITFISICLLYETKQNKQVFSSFICYFSIFTVAVSVALFIFPYDQNITSYYSGTVKEFIKYLIGN